MKEPLDKISQDLFKLLTLDIPETPPRELGFLDVVDHSTRETTICNVYRYFLDRKLSPQLSPIMIAALEELIAEKYTDRDVAKELDLAGYNVLLEVGTGKGRIDIVLDSEATKSVVMIEAKVYHWLHNDLEDYWNTYNYPHHQKAGIVLSLEPMSEQQMDNPNFISITHNQWLEKVCSKGLPSNLPIKDYIYFNDFVNNMNHLTKSNEMNEQAKFYFEHAQKVNQAIETKEAAFNFVIDQLKAVAAHFNWTLDGSSDYWRHLWDEINDATVYYTVYPEGILNENGKIQVILEIYSHALAHENALSKLIPPHLTQESYGRADFKHLASKTYHLETKDFDELADILTNGIEKDFEPIRKEMMVLLKQKNAHRHILNSEE